MTAEHVEVLIVGAGISGVGCAWHLQHARPGTSYAILDARGAIGGTWDLFRFPGIRSDSDVQTFGYAFKPWPGDEALARGPAILDYVREAAAENGIDRHVRFGHRVLRADWSSDDGRWTVEAERADTGETVRMTASWLFAGTGYYRYDAGYTPEFAGTDRFTGPIVHPQHWPADLDHAGKRVVVIGSGATAVTLVPALAERAAHVTMLQRSPSYVLSIPGKDAIAAALRRVLGERRGYALTRRKNIWLQMQTYALSRRRPRLAARIVRAGARRALPEGYDVDTHFRPRYAPWDQRVCFVPDGDLFAAIDSGRASVVTDTIETFTERGLTLASGAQLEADVIVTATGLNLLAFGGIALGVDGRDVAPPDAIAYRGMMLGGVPNFAFAFGYTNASWTLKVDLVCARLCRMLAELETTGHDYCVPELGDGPLETRPLLDLTSGYVQRSIDALPRQGTAAPWHMPMSYTADVASFRDDPVADGTLRLAYASRNSASATSGNSTTDSRPAATSAT